MKRYRENEEADRFFLHLKKHFPGVEVVKEYQFHPDRKWRFDYAFPDRKVAIEIDGAIWTLGRHNRPAGYVADIAKLNKAASMGWLVLRFPTDERFYLQTRKLIEATLSNISNDGSEGNA